MATVNELVTALGFELSPNAQATLDKYQGQIDSFKNYAGKIGSAIKDMAQEGLEAAGRAKTLSEWSLSTGMDTDRLQKWARVAQKSGIEAERLYSDLERFKQAGATEPQILEWADRLKSADFHQRISMAKDLGLDKETLQVWIKGSDALRGMLNNAKVIDKELIQSGKEVNDIWSSIWGTIIRVKDEMILIGVDKVKEPLKRLDEFMESEKGEDATAAGILTTGVFSTLGAFKFPAFAKTMLAFTKGLFASGTATTATTTTATGLTAGGFLTAIGSLTILGKALYDNLAFVYSLSKHGTDEALNNLRKPYESVWDYLNVPKGTVSTVDAIAEAFGADAIPYRAQTNDNRTITNNIYVATPAQAREIIAETGGLQSSTPGGMSSMVQ